MLILVLFILLMLSGQWFARGITQSEHREEVIERLIRIEKACSGEQGQTKEGD